MAQSGPVAGGTAAAPVVRVAGLRREFGGLAAVAGVDFNIPAGGIFGLIGPDGAGKTTTLRILAGVLAPTAGEVTVLGEPMRRPAAAVRGLVGYMPQRFGLYEDLTVAENLRFFADLFHVPRRRWRERRAEVLAFSGLEPFLDRLAGRLSGGMKQKLGLACVLIHSPRFLVLDEPTNGVDPVSRREFWKILYRVSEEGVAIAVATAYLDEAERCHQVGLMAGGAFLMRDSPEGLREAYPGAVAAVTGGDPVLARDALREAGWREAAIFGDRLHLRVDDPGEEIPRIADVLESTGGARWRVRRATPTLEDVFVAAVSRVVPEGPEASR